MTNFDNVRIRFSLVFFTLEELNKQTTISRLSWSIHTHRIPRDTWSLNKFARKKTRLRFSTRTIMNYAVPSDELPPHSPGRRGVRNNNNNNNPAINSPRFSSSRGAAPGSPRQITGYTSMGSPIYGWDRSQSQGTTPYGLALPKSPYQMPSRSLSATLDGAPPQHDGLHGPAIPLLPPEPTETQKAMEAAAAKERQRSKELEEQELNLSADRLREILKQERHRMARMAADLAKFRSTAVQSQLEAEMIEEGRINGLMRRLEYLQQEKGRIIVELEREEEMVRLISFSERTLRYLLLILAAYSSPIHYKRSSMKCVAKSLFWKSKSKRKRSLILLCKIT